MDHHVARILVAATQHRMESMPWEVEVPVRRAAAACMWWPPLLSLLSYRAHKPWRLEVVSCTLWPPM